MKKSGSHKGRDNHKHDKHHKDRSVEATKDLINKYRVEYEKSLNLNNKPPIAPEVFLHLASLKKIITEPKQVNPDQAYKEIQENLGPAESSETLRQERWPEKICCPYCNSTNIERLPPSEQKDEHIYKYLCLKCHEKFNDDSETDMASGVPPLNSWMMCWYLLGVTDSLQYIASKLGLSMATVERMIRHMRNLFNAEQPLKHMLSYDQWMATRGGKVQETLQRDLDIKAEQHTGYTPGGKAARDTAEVRRQKTRDTLHMKSALRHHSTQTQAPKRSGRSSTPKPRSG